MIRRNIKFIRPFKNLNGDKKQSNKRQVTRALKSKEPKKILLFTRMNRQHVQILTQTQNSSSVVSCCCHTATFNGFTLTKSR